MRKAVLIAGMAISMAVSAAGCSGPEDKKGQADEEGTTSTVVQASTESTTCPNSAVSGCSGYSACGSRVVKFTKYDGTNSTYPADVAVKGIPPVALRSGLAFCKNRVLSDISQGSSARSGYVGRGCAPEPTATNDDTHDPASNGAVEFLKAGLTDDSTYTNGVWSNGSYYADCPSTGPTPGVCPASSVHDGISAPKCTPGKKRACYVGDANWIGYERVTGLVDFQFNPNIDASRSFMRERVFDRDLIERAAKDKCGMVYMKAEVEILKPISSSKMSGTMIYDVLNRGNKTAVPVFHNRAGATPPGTKNAWGFPDFRSAVLFTRTNSWALGPDAGDPGSDFPMFRAGDTVVSSAFAGDTANIALPGTNDLAPPPGLSVHPSFNGAFDMTTTCNGEDDNPTGGKNTNAKVTGCKGTTATGSGIRFHGRPNTFVLANGNPDAGSTITWASALTFRKGVPKSTGSVACTTDTDCSVTIGGVCNTVTHLCAAPPMPSFQESQLHQAFPSVVFSKSTTADCTSDTTGGPNNLGCSDPARNATDPLMTRKSPKCYVNTADPTKNRCVPGCSGKKQAAQCTTSWDLGSTPPNANLPLPDGVGDQAQLTCNCEGKDNDCNGSNIASTGICQCPPLQDPEIQTNSSGVAIGMICNTRRIARRPAADAPDPVASLPTNKDDATTGIELRWWKSPAMGTPRLAGETTWDPTMPEGAKWCPTAANGTECGVISGSDWTLTNATGTPCTSTPGATGPQTCTHIQLASSATIVAGLPLSAGFNPNVNYGVYYRKATNGLVHGIEYPLIRETVSFLRRSIDSTNPLSPGGVSKINKAIMFGSSLSGMVLKDMLYRGYNTVLDPTSSPPGDWNQRKKLADGMFIASTGAKRWPGGVGENVQRYQYGRQSGVLDNKSYPPSGEVAPSGATPADFPFTYASLEPPLGFPSLGTYDTGEPKLDGILFLCSERADCPFVEHMDTGKEVFRHWASMVWTYRDRYTGELMNAPGIGHFNRKIGTMVDIVGGTQHLPATTTETWNNCGTAGNFENRSIVSDIEFKQLRMKDLKEGISNQITKVKKAVHPTIQDLVRNDDMVWPTITTAAGHVGVNIRKTGLGTFAIAGCSCPSIARTGVAASLTACPYTEPDATNPAGTAFFAEVIGGVSHRSINHYTPISIMGDDSALNTADDIMPGMTSRTPMIEALVPVLDSLGNWKDSYSMLPVDVRVPIGTHMSFGRKRFGLGAGEESNFFGGFRPLAKRTADKGSDTRPSFNQLYCVANDDATSLGAYPAIWNCVNNGGEVATCRSNNGCP